jgi:hypothetical protein
LWNGTTIEYFSITRDYTSPKTAPATSKSSKNLSFALLSYAPNISFSSI